MLVSTGAFLAWLVVFAAATVYFADEVKRERRKTKHDQDKTDKLMETLGR